MHGTFVGDDFFGLTTELSRFLPSLGNRLGRCRKRLIESIAGETGNYTREFAHSLERGLAKGAGHSIPVRLFRWSSQNNHIGRADGAVRLIDELADLATKSDSGELRIQLWGHSHGGNVMALASQLLGTDLQGRDAFFTAAESFYRPWVRKHSDMPRWVRVRELLDAPSHPVRRLQLDMVTFGTPIRYGWNAIGYANLLHFIHHRPPLEGQAYHAPIPLKLTRAFRALDGDYVQQIGIAGTNLMPLPCALRSWLADWRLDQFLEAEVKREGLIPRIRHATRVPEEGTTLLVDYQGIEPSFFRHIAGHALYTRRKWLPFHCREIASHFYANGASA